MVDDVQVDINKTYFKRQTLRVTGPKDEDGTPNIEVDPPTGRVKQTVTTPQESLDMTGHLEREDMPRWAALDAKVRTSSFRWLCMAPKWRDSERVSHFFEYSSLYLFFASAFHKKF